MLIRSSAVACAVCVHTPGEGWPTDPRDAIGHAQRRTYTLGTAPTLGAVGVKKIPTNYWK